MEKATFLNVMLAVQNVLDALLIKIVATASYPRLNLVIVAAPNVNPYLLGKTNIIGGFLCIEKLFLLLLVFFWLWL